MTIPTQSSPSSHAARMSPNELSGSNAKSDLMKKAGLMRGSKSNFAQALKQGPGESQATDGHKKGTESETRLIKNFDNMLKLLLTGLKNQSPLEPMKAQEFTEQLVQFANVEQAIQTNKQLAEIKDLMDQNQTLANLQLVDRQVNLVSDRVEWKGEPIEITVAPTAEKAKRSVVSIIAEDGSVIRSFDLRESASTQKITWEGVDAKKSPMPHGSYKIMAMSLDEKNVPTSLETSVLTRVEGIDFTTDVPTLVAGSVRVPVTSVQQIYAKNIVSMNNQTPKPITKAEAASAAEAMPPMAQMAKQQQEPSNLADMLVTNEDATIK
jgi:flagellar basal-body rod modification protein FlgD